MASWASGWGSNDPLHSRRNLSHKPGGKEEQGESGAGSAQAHQIDPGSRNKPMDVPVK